MEEQHAECSDCGERFPLAEAHRWMIEVILPKETKSICFSCMDRRKKDKLYDLRTRLNDKIKSRMEQAYQDEKEREDLPVHHRNLNLPNLKKEKTVFEFGEGDIIEVYSFGHWYRGEVLSTGRTRYKSRYTTGSGSTRDKTFLPHKIRKEGSGA